MDSFGNKTLTCFQFSLHLYIFIRELRWHLLYQETTRFNRVHMDRFQKHNWARYFFIYKGRRNCLPEYSLYMFRSSFHTFCASCFLPCLGCQWWKRNTCLCIIYLFVNFIPFPPHQGMLRAVYKSQTSIKYNIIEWSTITLFLFIILDFYTTCSLQAGLRAVHNSITETSPISN